MAMPGEAPPSRFNFAAHLAEHNAHRASKVAYSDDAATITYGNLERRARKVAGGFDALGLRREERVFVCLHDTIDFPATFLGALYAGVVPVCANTLLTVEDYVYMLEHSRAQALVVSGALLPALREAMQRAVHEIRHVIVSRPAGAPDDGAVEFTTWCEAATPRESCATRSRLDRVLVVFVRLDRASERHGAFAWQPVLDCANVRRARIGPDRARCRVLGREALLRVWPRQCADVSAVRRCERDIDAGAAYAGGRVQAPHRE